VTRKADSHELDQSDTTWNVFMSFNLIGFSFMPLVGLVQVGQAKLALPISHMLLLFTAASSRTFPWWATLLKYADRIHEPNACNSGTTTE
jgi:hypothetical protein